MAAFENMKMTYNDIRFGRKVKTILISNKKFSHNQNERIVRLDKDFILTRYKYIDLALEFGSNTTMNQETSKFMSTLQT